jgi:hypothetical protein
MRTELARNRADIEQRQRLRKAITAAAHFENFKPGFVESMKRVPNRRARYVERLRHRLAGTELTVGKQLQRAKRVCVHRSHIE